MTFLFNDFFNKAKQNLGPLSIFLISNLKDFRFQGFQVKFEIETFLFRQQ